MVLMVMFVYCAMIPTWQRVNIVVLRKNSSMQGAEPSSWITEIYPQFDVKVYLILHRKSAVVDQSNWRHYT